MDILCQASRWFTNYVRGFKTDNPNINQNIELKQEHTEKVVLEAYFFVKSLRLA